MDIVASDTFGRPVKLTYQKIHQILFNTSEGSAHVFAHYPKMVVIHRMKDKEWSILVEELYNADEYSPLITVYSVSFEDERIEAAINLFLALIKSQRKDFEHNIYKKLGKFVLLNKNTNGDINDGLQKSVGKGTVRGRRRPATGKGKKNPKSCEEDGN